VAVEGAGGWSPLEIPDGAKEVMPGENAGGLAGEVEEQGVLAGAQMKGMAVQEDRARAWIDQEGTDAKR
jgi:hypothetical protein